MWHRYPKLWGCQGHLFEVVIKAPRRAEIYLRIDALPAIPGLFVIKSGICVVVTKIDGQGGQTRSSKILKLPLSVIKLRVCLSFLESSDKPLAPWVQKQTGVLLRFHLPFVLETSITEVSSLNGRRL